MVLYVKEFDRVEMDSDTARELAVEKEREIKFENFNDEGIRDQYGTALPCGCIHNTRCLSDGTLGCEGWSNPCWDHFIATE